MAIKVRDLFPATTILFYSGDADEVELRNLIAQKKVEGVFCSHRNRFIERTGTLIDQLSQSLNRLSGMRGLAMRVVAECDEILEQAIQFMTSRSEQYKATMGDLDKDVCSSIRERKKQYRDAMQGNLDDRLGTHAIDSSKLHNHFRRQSRIVTGNSVDFGLSEAQAERLRELRASTAQYEQDVLTIRNVLAHAMEKKTTNGWILKGHKEEDKGIKVEDFPSIRRTFASHVKDFAEMKNLICPPDQQAGQ
ncbi:MAG: hypothetical protein OXC53_12400 [Rhodobacteraceae bacterium]|nr:hypothetical protein [Paracoccaceae bacterium]